MKTSLLITTAAGLLFSAAASAQSPTSPSSPPAQAPATTAPAPTSAQPASPSGPAATAPAPQTPTSDTPASNQNAQTAPRSNDTTPASKAAAPANNAAAPASTALPSNVTTSSGMTSTAPSDAASQNVPSNVGSNSPATAPANNQQNANTPTSNTTNVNASVNLNTQQQTRISDTLSRTRVQPLTSVNFSLSVGTVIPRNVTLHTVPADVVEIVPQYRGFSYVVVKDEFVIIDPSTYRIVTVLPRSGASTAATSPVKRSTLADRDRDAARKYSKTTTERKTVGSSSSVQVRRGERLPSSVEIEEFPETVYRDAPALKEYRYIRRDSRTYLVDPAERVVIEEID